MGVGTKRWVKGSHAWLDATICGCEDVWRLVVAILACMPAGSAGWPSRPLPPLMTWR